MCYISHGYLQVEELQRRCFLDERSPLQQLPVITESIPSTPSIRRRTLTPSVVPTAAPAADGSTSEPATAREALTFFNYVHVGKLQVFGSFKGQRSIEDIIGITIVIHEKKYSSRTCTKTAMLKKLRNDVVSDLLKQVNSIKSCATAVSLLPLDVLSGWSKRANLVELRVSPSGHPAWPSRHRR